MNKERREKLKTIKSTLSNVLNNLESVKDEEEFAFDNMPENLQYSMRGEDSQEAIECMDKAVDLITEAIESIEEVV